MEKQKQEEKIEDLGLGVKIIRPRRFINKDGEFNVVKVGQKEASAYQALVEEKWSRLLIIFIASYIAINLVFALLFMTIGVEYISIEPKSFIENLAGAFYFSVQTFTTVGYGRLVPIGVAANILASLVAFIGLLSFALATSLLFARFAKPVPNILFSKHAVICNYKGGKGFMFRIVNKRSHKIIDVKAGVMAIWLEDVRGVPKRRFANLELELDHIFLFPMNWTVVHPIDKNSLFYHKSKTELENMNLEVIVQIDGYDESFNQRVHANSSYLPEEIVWGKRFAPMVTADKMGMVVHIDKIDDLEMDN